MPNKKGSRVAASQARAKEAARKKARAGGPDLGGVAARPVVMTDEFETEEGVELEESAVAVAQEIDGSDEDAAAPVAVAVAPRRTRAASRRERAAMSAVASGSLRWELSLIAAATAAIGIGLTVVKLATDLGR